jgi:LysR family glycine cleavage system transcriptional activator
LEAAARHQSYTHAARELGLTHSAISHRIRELERRRQAVLFRRAGNRMLPTAAGQQLLAQVRTAIHLLEQAFAGPSAGRARQRISIDVLPAFAVRWLAPRLHLLRQALPELELNLSMAVELSTFTDAALDAAIRFGPGKWPGIKEKRLAGEVLFPVCSPAYRSRMAIRRPADLERCTLLRHPWQEWSSWLSAAGLAASEPIQGSSYADAGVILQAATAHEGVALARGLVVLDDLRAGRLVRLFKVSVPDRYAYYLVHPVTSFPNAALAAFESWLVAAINEDLGDPHIRPGAPIAKARRTS